MLRILLSLITVVAVAAESAGQQPAPTVPPAPSAGNTPATYPPRRPRRATASDTCNTLPYQLAPARINAEGELVVRHHVELSEIIPCVALRKAADGKTAEERRWMQPLKPIVCAVHEFFYLADMSWFDRNGKQVDAATAREQLAKWTPVLVFWQNKNRQCLVQSGFPVQFGGLLLESYRSDVLIAVAPESASLGTEWDALPAKGPVPESPFPTRACMDEKGRVVFRPGFKPVSEQRVKTKTYNTETGTETTEQSYYVFRPIETLEELAVEPKYVQFFDTEGNPVEAATAAQRLAKEATVLVSGDGEKVNAFYLKAVQPGTLVCVLPFDIWTARTAPAPPKAAPAPPCKAPAKAPNEEAAPLPSAAPTVAPPPSPGTTAGSTSSGPSPATERTAGLAEWENLKYGMFIHFGMATFTGGSPYGIAHESPSTYAPSHLDVRQWIRVAKGAGMKYAVLTAKHFSGFCLWPSDVDDYNVKSGGDKTDVVAEFMKACKEEGIKPGLFYAIPDGHNESTVDWKSSVGEAYFQLIRQHITELHTRYPGIAIQWFLATNKFSSQQQWELYRLIKKLSPDCVVVMAGSFPTDVNSIYGAFMPQTVSPFPRYSPVEEVGGKTYYLPLESRETLSQDWFWTPTNPPKCVDTLKKLYSESVGRGGNLLLNVPPDKTGQIPIEYVARLQEFKQAIDAMESNGKP